MAYPGGPPSGPPRGNASPGPGGAGLAAPAGRAPASPLPAQTSAWVAMMHNVTAAYVAACRDIRAARRGAPAAAGALLHVHAAQVRLFSRPPDLAPLQRNPCH